MSGIQEAAVVVVTSVSDSRCVVPIGLIARVDYSCRGTRYGAVVMMYADLVAWDVGLRAWDKGIFDSVVRHRGSQT
jgi:hypothetical protein